ncbi:NADH:ubiquinone oxidoreductase intermediate-associated protein 30, partial [Aspergillus karnatakaensis]|uniref:CIA30 family protein n=1 Tax=Aspergillus karnatakaensis TaxID=1810916 RepID=UPI003CCD6A0A
MAESNSPYLFGGPHPWSSEDWTSSDDRVRGGSSYSELIPSADPKRHTATFKGNLDTSTLGGAGFASQRTTSDKAWDLSGYKGLELEIVKSDGKLYTVTLKDEILPRRDDGRERSSLSWEGEIRVPKGEGKNVVIKFGDLKPTYRGKEVERDGKELDLKKVRRIGIMMRSFFDEQKGDFEVEVGYIKGWSEGRGAWCNV